MLKVLKFEKDSAKVYNEKYYSYLKCYNETTQ